MKLPEHLALPGISEIHPVQGGSINDAFCLQLKSGTRLFLKRNSAGTYPGMFRAEERGLKKLASGGARVPSVLATWEDAAYQYILMEYLPPSSLDRTGWENAGEMLARLHRESAGFFGLDHNNFMGSLVQVNTPTPSFALFFAEHRILPQIRLSREKSYLNREQMNWAEDVCDKLPQLIPEEISALVHGDLWRGNLHASGGIAWVIDPAVAFNHREMDLAMSMLFGHFPDVFYQAYQEAFPLEAGWSNRVDLFNFYPLLIHLNLFESGYLPDVLDILKKYR